MDEATAPGLLLLPSKVRAKIRVDDERGCWLWVGHVRKDGYGQVAWPPGGRRPPSRLAHRIIWQLLKGPIPDGLVLDHQCHVRRCVRPDHLECVTHSTNAHRVRSAGQPNTDGLCRNKRHPWVPANIRILYDGRQACAECLRENWARRRATTRNRKARPGKGQAPMF